MALEFVPQWWQLGWSVSAIATLASLVWLYRAVPRSPLRDAFAAMVVVLLLNLALYPFYWSTPDDWFPLAEFPDNAVALTSAWFLVAWLAARNGRPLPRWLPLPFVAGIIAIVALWIAFPGIRTTTDSMGQSADGHGLLFSLENVFEVIVGVAIATVFFRTAVRRDSVPLALAGFGFLWSYIFGFWYLVTRMDGRWESYVATLTGDGPTNELLRGLAHAGSTVYLVGVAVYLALVGERNRTRSIVVWTLAGVAVATGFFTVVSRAPGFEGWTTGGDILAGLSALMLPVFGTLYLVTEAHVTYEGRVWSTVRKASVPALMLGTFFVVSETAQTFLSGALGPIVGILATVPLVLLIAPIHRLGERFAHAVAPRAADQSLPERETIYERQVRYAWVDGRIGATEHARLADLRKALGVSAERAAAIEEDVVSGLARPHAA